MIPKNFMPKKKGLEKRAKELTNLTYDLGTVSDLLLSCNDFREKIENVVRFEELYEVGEKMVKTICYTKYDLEMLSPELSIRPDTKDEFLGLYISALVNKVITKQDNINLKLKEELIGIGSYLQKGTLTIEGNVKWLTAVNMTGGKLIVKGRIDGSTGIQMKEGGIVMADQIDDIDVSCKGTIYKRKNQKYVQIWP